MVGQGGGTVKTHSRGHFMDHPFPVNVEVVRTSKVLKNRRSYISLPKMTSELPLSASVLTRLCRLILFFIFSIASIFWEKNRLESIKQEKRMNQEIRWGSFKGSHGLAPRRCILPEGCFWNFRGKRYIRFLWWIFEQMTGDFIHSSIFKPLEWDIYAALDGSFGIRPASGSIARGIHLELERK